MLLFNALNMVGHWVERAVKAHRQNARALER